MDLRHNAILIAVYFVQACSLVPSRQQLDLPLTDVSTTATDTLSPLMKGTIGILFFLILAYFIYKIIKLILERGGVLKIDSVSASNLSLSAPKVMKLKIQHQGDRAAMINIMQSYSRVSIEPISDTLYQATFIHDVGTLDLKSTSTTVSPIIENPVPK